MAGAVTRDFWTCGSFAEIGGSLKRKPRFGILVLSLEVLLLRIALAGLRGVNLDAQISWQAQCFVDLAVMISWQAQHFVDLDAWISWQGLFFLDLRHSTL